MKGYIYKYTFPDGKVYIGQTRRPIEMRHAEHLSPSRGPLNSGFWEAYQTVGTPSLSILETIETNDVTALVEQLNRRETVYIYTEKATDPAYGYNKKTIATTYSPDINILNREFDRMYKQLVKEREPFFDMLTEKLLQGDNGNLSEEEKAFVQRYLDEEYLFDNPVDAELDDDDFQYILADEIDHAIWQYTEDSQEIIAQYISENAEEIIRKAKLGKIIQQLDLEGNIIRKFESQDEIRDTFNIRSLNNITNVIKGKQKTAYGYIWRYKPVSEER